MPTSPIWRAVAGSDCASRPAKPASGGAPFVSFQLKERSRLPPKPGFARREARRALAMARQEGGMGIGKGTVGSLPNYLPATLETYAATASICAFVSRPLNAGMILPPFVTCFTTRAFDGFS
jgi:hypothetical protein